MSGTHLATKRKPLDLMQKWHVVQYWSQQTPPLKRATFTVLMRLLDRQNTKTGRCDPSAVGLAEETGFSERSVRSAFKELEERGAVKRFRITLRSRNQFLIFSVSELRQNTLLAERKPRAGLRTGLNSVSALPATRCRLNLRPASPETIKETKKKKEDAENAFAHGPRSHCIVRSSSSGEMDLGQFEQRVVKVFEREGYGYEGLLALPAQDAELAHGLMVTGELTFSGAVARLLKRYRNQKEQM
ncbi:helix-turn-helix domain-containing protein [uncultured Shimia sp.]|uniref:helix-turn-helix domain-containing protein n=1 Tax=uncultured Shimia sp. TaxID=573152 RepID=UPI0025EB5CF2|nr:helix-turn-helix domain-containing protein [uncultured Shimia sp.]